jgi:hypothetical protein
MTSVLARRSAPSLLALTAMLLTLGLTGVEDGIVLCFGDDGHVALEVVGPDGCTEVDETSDPAASALAISVSSSHCGPCVDVALTSSSATAVTKGTNQTPSAPSLISSAALRLRVPHLQAASGRQHTRRFISEKPHTVVIRC